MQKYINSVIGESGRPIGGATVKVYLTGTQTLASIYSDNGVTAQANPFTADSTGMFSFYAADGRYDIQIVSGSTNKTLTDILFEDPSDSSSINVTTLTATTVTTDSLNANTAQVDGSPVSTISTLMIPSTGAAVVGYVSEGAGAVTRTIQNREREKISVLDYGTISQAADVAASREADLFFPDGNYDVGSTIDVVMNMGLIMSSGAWLKPTANINVIQAQAGSTVIANVDTSENSSWDSVALDYVAVSQLGAGSDLSFQLNTKTFFDVKMKGVKSGTGHGTAIKLHSDVANNGGIAGVVGKFWTDGFDNCLWLVNNIADGTRWVNGNIISGFCNFPIRALRMDDVSTYGGGMAGNKIKIHCETRPSSVTTALFELAGQNNDFDIMPWDFDGGSGGSVPAIIFTGTFSASRLQTFCDPATINFTNIGNTSEYINFYAGAGGRHASQFTALPGQALLLKSDSTSSNLNLSVPNASGSITFSFNGIQRLSMTNSGNLFWRGAAASGGITLRNFNTTGTIDLPTVSSSDVIVAAAATQTLTNKTLTKPVITVQLVSALGTATQGLTSTVSDSNVAASGNFGAVVVGGGSNVVPVYADGTNWRIG